MLLEWVIFTFSHRHSIDFYELQPMIIWHNIQLLCRYISLLFINCSKTCERVMCDDIKIEIWNRLQQICRRLTNYTHRCWSYRSECAGGSAHASKFNYRRYTAYSVGKNLNILLDMSSRDYYFVNSLLWILLRFFRVINKITLKNLSSSLEVF